MQFFLQFFSEIPHAVRGRAIAKIAKIAKIAEIGKGREHPCHSEPASTGEVEPVCGPFGFHLRAD
jgi:hypothetical protein